MLRALLIGVDEYAHPDIPPLAYARADVEHVATYLRNQLEDDVSIDRLEADQATFANISNAIDRLEKVIRGGDRLMLYFAGHGTMGIPDPQSDVKAYLAPWEVDPRNVSKTSYELHVFLPKLLRPLYERGARLLIVVDACFKPTGEPGSRAFQSKSVGEGHHLNIRPILPAPKRDRSNILITATQINDVAYEDHELRHGVFTHHLIAEASKAAEVGPVKIDPLVERVVARTEPLQTPTYSAWDALGATFPSRHDRLQGHSRSHR